MDIAWIKGALRVAENGRKRIVSYDRDGKRIGSWAKDNGDDADVETFGRMLQSKEPDGGTRTARSTRPSRRAGA